ncbi:MAG: sulfite exporter TauE/SafE family protein [Anaerolineae bacterium]|nr:sulfite exporter TauE/SafE family protein [Anaerolineae bacterium]
METETITLPLAFLAGLLSFVSPCVLPLVPAYMGYLGGTAVASGEEGNTWRTFVHALLFVVGFALIFILLGASATFIGRLLRDYALLLQRVGGALLVVFGMRLMAIGWNRDRWIAAATLTGLATLLLSSNTLFGRLEEGVLMAAVILAGAGFATPVQAGLAMLAGLLNFLSSYDATVPKLVASLLIALSAYFMNQAEFFYSEKKIEIQHTGRAESRSGAGGYWRSLLFGFVFAAGWTPCVGPILAGILFVASQLNTVGQGILLLTAYSLGLGIPFLVVGLAFGPLSRWLRRANRYLGLVSIVSGVLLILMGVLIFTDSLSFLAQYGTFLDIEL